MKARFWGVRGSIPSPPKPEEIESKIYEAIFGLSELDTNDQEAVRTHVQELPALMRGTAGGNTPCVEVRVADDIFILDAGSGIRELGFELMNGPCGQGQGTLHLFFSHPHWDHIQGFPFFVPAYVAGNRIFIYSGHDLEQTLHEQQRFQNFPVPFSYMQADLQFIRLQVGQTFSIGDVQVSTVENAHPGKSYAYRFADEHSVLVYATDAEYKDLSDASVQPHLEFFKDADALIFDAQYTLSEGWQKKDWGHSSALIGVDLARAAGVKRLILFHHDPTYSDKQLQEIELAAIAYLHEVSTEPTCQVLVAYEGLTLDLTPRVVPNLEMTAKGEAAILKPLSVFDEQGVNHLAQQLAGLAEPDGLAGSIIDLSQVETLTTASLKSLITLHNERPDVPIILAGPSASAKQVIKLSGCLDYFALYPSVEAALVAIHTREALNLPGQVINNRYQIEENLGEGPYGTILDATDLKRPRPVVLKILNPSLSDETLTRLERQVRALTNLEHPHIVRVYAWERVEDHCFIVEEKVDAPTLQELLRDENNPISADQALDIALDLTVTLEHVHSRGFVHGDLKPQNIFLTEDGVKISDFGLGQIDAGRNLLDAPMPHLSAAHLAPEQILGQPLDARTDLYTMGVIFFQLATGHLPFEGSDREVMEAHLWQTPRPPRELNPLISPTLEHLILKHLAKNPNDRYVSAQQTRRISESLIVRPGEITHRRRGGLVGREQPLRTLSKLWDEARTGRGKLVFISGESGIGKTSLALHFAAQTDTPVLLIGNCRDQIGSSAYHLFVELIQTYLATVPPELFDEDARHSLSRFARQVPNVRQLLPGLTVPPPLEPEHEHLRIMSGLTQFIERATQKRPWLIILDDLQWIDQNSLELLQFIGRNLASQALLVIGIFRDLEREPDHPLHGTLHALNNDPTYERINLDRLDEGRVGQLLANVWQQAVPSQVTAAIYQHTAGNPFYVEEVVKALVDDGLIRLEAGKWQFPEMAEVRLPQHVHEAVWRRIHHLSPDTQTLLRRAAVLGQSFRFVELCDMSDLSEWEVLEQLDMALERHLVHEVPGQSHLRFSHTEIHHVLYADMGDLRRRMLHRQAGEVLERRAAPEPESLAAELAFHFKQADEVERALVYSIQAGRQAEATFSSETALLWYQQALELLDQLDQEETSQFKPLLLSVHLAMAKVRTAVGQYEAALAQYDLARLPMEAETPSPEQQRHLADLYRQIAAVFERQGEFTTARRWLERGLACLVEAGPTIEAAQIYLAVAGIDYRQGHDQAAVASCQKCIELLMDLDGDPSQQWLARAYTLVGAIYTRLGNYERAAQSYQAGLAGYQRLDDVSGQSQVYHQLGLAYHQQGDWKQAEETLRHSLEMKQASGDLFYEAATANSLANLYLNRGEWKRARSLYEQSQVIWRQLGVRRDEGVSLGNLAQLNICQGKLAEAFSLLAESQSVMSEFDKDEFAPVLERRWGELYLKSGDYEQALTHAGRSVDLAVEQRSALEEGIARRLLGQVHLARGDWQPAKVALTRSLQILSALDSVYEIGRTGLALAELAARTRSMDEIQAHLPKAIEIFERLGARADLAAAQALAKDTEP